MRQSGFESLDNIWMGSDFDGAFAQFVKVPAGEVFAVAKILPLEQIADAQGEFLEKKHVGNFVLIPPP
jgi:hypothetical protein